VLNNRDVTVLLFFPAVGSLLEFTIMIKRLSLICSALLLSSLLSGCIYHGYHGHHDNGRHNGHYGHHGKGHHDNGRHNGHRH
jgi:hypothetical protein